MEPYLSIQCNLTAFIAKDLFKSLVLLLKECHTKIKVCRQLFTKVNFVTTETMAPIVKLFETTFGKFLVLSKVS